MNPPTTRRLAIMNLALSGIEADFGKEHADTSRVDQHPDLRADYVLANGSMAEYRQAALRTPAFSSPSQKRVKYVRPSAGETEALSYRIWPTEHTKDTERGVVWSRGQRGFLGYSKEDWVEPCQTAVLSA